MTTTEEPAWDAVIIGSGAGGGALAQRLSENGWRVLVLEKGPRFNTADYQHDELAVIHRSLFTPDPITDPHLVVTRKTTNPVRHKLGWSASCFGGGTEHMGAYLYRFHPDDFRQRTLYGDYQELADWPFDYTELEPYYCAAEDLLGVAGDSEALAAYAPRSRDLPLPPLRSHPIAKALEAACEDLKMTASPTPRSVNSLPYRGRPACQYCQRCGGYGCPIGARGTSQSALLNPAQQSGHCTIRHQCMVTEILLKNERTVSGCCYIDDMGQRHQVHAKYVAVACSAVETARLLLLSRSSTFPNGLANRSGLVGKHLQFHGVTLGIAEYDVEHFNHLVAESNASAPNTAEPKNNAADSPFIGRSVYDHYQIPAGVAPLRRGGIIRFSTAAAEPINDAIAQVDDDAGPKWGEPLLHALANFYPRRRRIGYEVFHDFIANANTFIHLDEQINDRWGLPAARIHLHVDSHQVTAGQWLAEQAEKVLKRLGARNIHRSVTGGTTAHLMHGACRASDDPTTGVVNRDCRTHDVDNLFIVDASFMPSAGIAPPTLTIIANALRVADILISLNKQN